MSPEDVTIRLAEFLRDHDRDEARQRMIEMLLRLNETPQHAAARVDMALEEMDGNPFRPIIAVNQDNGNLIEEARAAFTGANKPPSVFLRGGVLARVGRDDDGRAIIIAMTRPDIKATLAQMVSWSAIAGTTGKRTPSGVPAIVCDYFSAKADQMTDVPVIESVVTAPVFARDGTLITAPGYNPAARVWFEPVDSMRLRPVSARPSQDEVRSAAWFLMTEYLGDFPYVDEASRQHALGCLLLPFARLMIDGPVPLQAADASTPGTGKGLLQRAQMYPALGSMLPALPGHFGDEDELKKLITGILMEGQQVIRWDNVVARLDSPVLASLLTEPVFQGRLLGFNKTVPLPMRAIPMVNGNNLGYSHEISRRVVSSRLAVQDREFAEKPWLRRKFRHDPLIGWARQHRGDLVHAALTLIQGWIAAGRPPGSRSIGSFEEWSKVIGGIVEFAAGPGCSAFLTGMDALYEDAVSDRDERIEFLEAWHQRLGSRPQTPKQLLAALGDVEPFGITAQGSVSSQSMRLGHVLTKMRDQVWGGYKVVRQGRMYCVQKAG
jgi:putative DNA primase/helicase